MQDIKAVPLGRASEDVGSTAYGLECMTVLGICWRSSNLAIAGVLCVKLRTFSQ